MESDWQDTKVAQNLWALEVEAIERMMPDLYGHYLLQLSAFNQSVVKSTSLRHHFFASHRQNNQLVVDYEALPFRDNSVDCVVAHHIFDRGAAAHQCLREASRIVVPNGYLVIVGFNPYSTWGLSRLLSRYSLAPKGSYISQSRLLDWMTLLGFRVEQVSELQYFPPVVLRYFPKVSKQIDRLLRYIGLPGAGVYVLLARKLVAGRTPIRPQWRALGGRRIPVATPSTRGISVSSR
ncbi:class I SAM-dependent methyltransferase [Pseudomonas sp. HK3]